MAEHPRLKLLPDGPHIEIDGDSLFLGRDCHLALSIPALNNKVVSKRHCCFKKESDGQWTIEDLGSTNGTWLKGTRLTKRATLKSRDTVSLGRNGPQLQCELPPADAGATMLEDDVADSKTVLASPDGSAERPYKVGRTPELRLRHEKTGQLFQAKGYTIVIGRDPIAAQIVIRSEDEKHVSGRHAEIQFRSDSSVVVRDLGSSNGTWLNNRRLTGEARLALEDRLVLGNAPTVLVVVGLEN